MVFKFRTNKIHELAKEVQKRGGSFDPPEKSSSGSGRITLPRSDGGGIDFYDFLKLSEDEVKIKYSGTFVVESIHVPTTPKNELETILKKIK
jgi:hypothetical protein